MLSDKRNEIYRIKFLYVKLFAKLISKLILYNLNNKLIFKDFVINSITNLIYFSPHFPFRSKLFAQ